MKATIRSKKWYGRIWPPKRRKIKMMQAIVEYMAPEVEQKVNKAWRDYYIYGIEPTYTEYKEEKK